MRSLAILCVLVVATRAAAEPCGICKRGDELIEQLGVQALRASAAELAALEIVEPLPPETYARLVDMRRRAPVLGRLGALDDADLAAVAATLCGAATGACVEGTMLALRCLADRCRVALPHPKETIVATNCGLQTPHARSAPLGIGIQWGTGVLRSRYPADGRAWSLGIDARLRLTDRFGIVARIDRVAGRDEGTDADDNGYDDEWTGSITRIYALGGPTVVLHHARFEGEPRYLRLDLLGGYVSTRSQPAESGPAAGFDLSYQLAILRAGVRVVQGFGDARDATAVIGHLGFVGGATPAFHRDDDQCEGGRRIDRSHSSRLAIGLDIPLIGYGISSDLGILAPGIGFELAWNLLRRVDLLTHVDLLFYPGYERDRAIHHAALAGMRVDHGARRRSDDTGFFTTYMVGYTHGAVLTPTSTGSGPVADASIGWGLDADEGAANIRLHARSGISPDNIEYRAVYLSFGFELRLDPRQWRRGR